MEHHTTQKKNEANRGKNNFPAGVVPAVGASKKGILAWAVVGSISTCPPFYPSLIPSSFACKRKGGFNASPHPMLSARS